MKPLIIGSFLQMAFPLCKKFLARCIPLMWYTHLFGKRVTYLSARCLRRCGGTVCDSRGVRGWGRARWRPIHGTLDPSHGLVHGPSWHTACRVVAHIPTHSVVMWWACSYSICYIGYLCIVFTMQYQPTLGWILVILFQYRLTIATLTWTTLLSHSSSCDLKGYVIFTMEYKPFHG